MSKKKIMIIALALVLLLSASFTCWKLMDYHKGATDYREAAALALGCFANTRKPSAASSPAQASSTAAEVSSPEASASSALENAAASEEPSEEASASSSADEEPVSSQEPASSAPESTPSEDLDEPSEPEDTPSPTGTPAPPVDEFAQSLAQIDLEALQKVNPQVIGWICIPDTEVNYPLLQAEDNQHYLNYTWKNERSSVGSIFLEHTNKPDFSGFNTLVYGHQMADGSMFGQLERYRDQSFWEDHPNIYIATEEGVFRYDVFAAFRVGIEDIVYQLDLEKRKAQQKLIDFCLEQSTVDTGIQPSPKENVVTLSTCTGWGYSQRWVVVGTCTLSPREDSEPAASPAPKES